MSQELRVTEVMALSLPHVPTDSFIILLEVNFGNGQENSDENEI